MLYVVCYPLYAEVQPGNLSTLVNLSTGQIVKTITIKIVKVVHHRGQRSEIRDRR